MYTLGINAAFHDSAACLVRDGLVLAAAEEERFTHVKHAKRPIPFSTYELPYHAIDYCLREAGIELTDVAHVAYAFDPYLLLGCHADDATITLPLEPSAHPTPAEWDSAWDPLFLSSIVNAPRHLAGGAPHHLRERFRGVHPDGPYRWHFVEHHIAHAASAFLPSPFERSAVMTLDGRGERATTTYSIGHGSSLELLGEVDYPHSLGLLYEHVTEYLGFLPSSDEYKVMALASFGRPAYREDFRRLIRLTGDGQYTIAPLCLEERFGPARPRGAPLEQRHHDIASSLQVVLEEVVLELASWLHDVTGLEDLCLAGGVALNCVMNARLRDRGPFRHIWVQPAAGDSGTALGAALWIDAREFGRGAASEPGERSGRLGRGAASEPGKRSRPYRMDHAYLGPAYTDDEIVRFLRWTQVPYRRLTNVAKEAAELLARGKILGWFQGRMEFGPRALGARSILASPLAPDMQARLNEIKDREDFRPVAPVVLEEEAGKWFAGAGRGAASDHEGVGRAAGSDPQGAERPGTRRPYAARLRGRWGSERPGTDASPFMLFVYDVLPDKADRIPAVRHVDGTARIQTINRDQHPLYYDLLRAFKARTGVPVLVNTSFNTRGEPIVCTPRDAVECFWTSPLDALVIGSFLLEKPQVCA